MTYTLTEDMRITDGERVIPLNEIVAQMNTTYTEDSPEVERAARALATYYDGDDADWDTWIAGATIALNS